VDNWAESDSGQTGSDRWVDFANESAYVVLPSYAQLTKGLARISGLDSVGAQRVQDFIDGYMDRKMDNGFKSEPYQVDYCDCDTSYVVNTSTAGDLNKAGKSIPRMRVSDLVLVEDSRLIQDDLARRMSTNLVRSSVSCPECGMRTTLSPYMVSSLDSHVYVQDETPLSLSLFAARSTKHRKAISLLSTSGFSRELVYQLLSELDDNANGIRNLNGFAIRTIKSLMPRYDSALDAMLMGVAPMVFNDQPFSRETPRVISKIAEQRTVSQVYAAVEQGVPSVDAFLEIVESDLDTSLIDSLLQGAV